MDNSFISLSGIARGCVSELDFLKTQIDVSNINHDTDCKIFTKIKTPSPSNEANNHERISMCACNVTNCNVGYDQDDDASDKFEELFAAWEPPSSMENHQMGSNSMPTKSTAQPDIPSIAELSTPQYALVLAAILILPYIVSAPVFE